MINTKTATYPFRESAVTGRSSVAVFETHVPFGISAKGRGGSSLFSKSISSYLGTFIQYGQYSAII